MIAMYNTCYAMSREDHVLIFVNGPHITAALLEDEIGSCGTRFSAHD